VFWKSPHICQYCMKYKCGFSELKARRTTYVFIEVLDPHISDNPMSPCLVSPRKVKPVFFRMNPTNRKLWVSLKPDLCDCTYLVHHPHQRRNQFSKSHPQRSHPPSSLQPASDVIVILFDIHQFRSSSTSRPSLLRWFLRIPCVLL